MARTLILFCAAITLFTGSAIAQLTQPTPAFGPAGDGPVTRGDSLQKQIDDLDQRLTALSDLQHEDRAQMHEVIKGNKGSSYVRLDTSMEKQRDEFKNALTDVLPKEGKVTIYNRMHNDESIAINGQMYDLIAGAHRTVTVPIGEFRVRVRNQPTQVRTVNFPSAEATVEIVPNIPYWQPYYVINSVYE